MGVARIGPPGCGHRTLAVVVLGNEAAAAVKNLDPGTFQGGSTVPLGLVRGEDVIRGVTPPRKLRLSWGRGRSPQPLPSRPSWGVGRASGPRGHVSVTQIG